MKMDNEHILVHYETPFEIDHEERASEQNVVLSRRLLSAIENYSPFGDDETVPVEEVNSLHSEVEEFTPPVLPTLKIGQANLAVAPISISSSKEYVEPVVSGNPLLVISAASREQKISDDFTVGEFCQAQSGKYKWSYARIDITLVEQLQLLRTFVNKPITVVDGYYTPKYFREVLKGSELKIGRDPHVTGRGAKISVGGYNANMIDIAIAAIVACHPETRVSIGNSTMALYVRQTAANDSRFTSYISDEKIKVNTTGFARAFEKLMSESSYTKYGRVMMEATSAMLRQILARRYGSKKELTWPDSLGNVISLMYDDVQDPNVILYVLAYSQFGYLMRFYFNDSTEGKIPTINALRFSFTNPSDIRSPHSPMSLLYMERQIDKTRFMQECWDRFRRYDRTKQENLVKQTFFDWRKQRGDKEFYDGIKKLIQQVYKENGYAYQQAPQHGPEGGTHRNLKETPANPDRPAFNLTGKYVVEFPAVQASPQNIGNLLLINQAGNFIAGKLIRIFDTSLTTPIVSRDDGTKYSELKDTITEFYGQVDARGAVCNLYPQQTIIITQNSGNKIDFLIMDNITKAARKGWQFEKVNSAPVLSAGVLDAFAKTGTLDKNFILNLSWIRPLPSQWKKFLADVKMKTRELEKAITTYYNNEEDMPSVRESKALSAMFDLERAYRHYLPNFEALVRYYKMFYYSVPTLWQPTKDREWMSRFDWIKRTLRDFRDLTDKDYVQRNFAGLYTECQVETEKLRDVYKYKINMSTEAIGFGPFARLEGTITIENLTDYNKYPQARRWPASSNNKVSHTFSLWNATLSLSLEKWRPKVSAKWDNDAEGETTEYYEFSDFSRAQIEMQEWTGVGYSVGGLEGSWTKRLVIITGIGKKELHLDGSDALVPDTLSVDVADDTKKDDKNDDSFIDITLPNVAFYKGEIDSKEVSTQITSLPPPDKFKTTYQLQNTTFFKHDDAELSPAAIEAIGRMCAGELSALTDPGTKVLVIGYTDASGDAEYNITLSNLRAKNTLTAILDRVGPGMTPQRSFAGLGEVEANARFEFTEKNAWLRKVIVTINGRAVLSLGEI
jgi:outer membrane protein OmpA-like peptidoglycan-associated protein